MNASAADVQVAAGHDHGHDHGSQLTGEHRGHETMHSEMFMILFGSMLVGQVALHVWKSRHFASYQLVTLFGVWIIPAIVSLNYMYIRMLVVWSLFTCVTAFLLRKASRRPLGQNTPRVVYAYFDYLYKGCYAAGVLGYFLVMLEFFGITHLFGEGHAIAQIGTYLLFYGVYYGVLTRDCAEVCTDRMASIMGFTKSGTMPSKTFNPLYCGICNEGLGVGQPVSVNSKESREAATLEAGAGERILELNCKHLFHEFCIRGWTIIGKKDTCPFCSEKVNLQANLRAPWKLSSQSVLWAHLLDSVRYIVVWNPLIVIVVQVLFNVLGLE